MQKFIYTPRSGSRLFCLAEETYMDEFGWTLEQLPNCSFEFLGEKAVWYSLHTAYPGAWWRREAKNLLIALASIHPTIAWDECGDINVITSPVGAIQQIRLLREIEPEARNAPPDCWRKVTAQLLSSGCYLLADAAAPLSGVDEQIVLPLDLEGQLGRIAVIPDPEDPQVQQSGHRADEPGESLGACG